jgi:hypothetical protein
MSLFSSHAPGQRTIMNDCKPEGISISRASASGRLLPLVLLQSRHPLNRFAHFVYTPPILGGKPAFISDG